MKFFSRSPFLWISATILSIFLYFFAFHFFPQTFPIINLNITMDMEQALEQADTITQQNNIGPSDYQSAALFHTDEATKTFVELEAGGTEALVAMMEEQLYMPYTWQVRHFKEHEKNEATILFTPDGKPYGLIETLSENIPGAQLSEKMAREIAEKKAFENWNINFDSYTLVESSQKMQISKRIDHTFVYERTNKKIGEGTYRLKIIVSGDTITQLTHFVKVPEAFVRRYIELRSANTLISFIARIIIFLLYLLGGIIGLYWIFRHRWYLIKQPFICGFILASFSILTHLNQLPSLWMKYNTALSTHIFFTQLFLSSLFGMVTYTAFYTLIIMTAESLTRRAFGNHPQFWTIFSTKNSSSYAILGGICGAYLSVGFNVAFVIAFYLFSLRYCGWWSPAETLFDPNILATYAPWFSPIAQSLNAGFIEECLFRAIPLAGAALLGTYCGKRNWWIVAALILQALVFGAAHADYPQIPSYARLIEMFIPSLIWGIIYLKCGLLTTIITHCVYDIIWMSIPIFISSTADTFAYKVIIVTITLLPFFRIIYARLKHRKWTPLSETTRNSAWQPAEITEEKEEAEITTKLHGGAPSFVNKLLYPLGIIGLIVWLLTTRFTHDGITITLDRNEAITHARTFLEQKDIILTTPWQTLPLMFTHYKQIPPIANQHIFIWKKGKKELYHALLGTYLEPAHWTIRYAQFDTDIIQRAQEYKLMLYTNSVFRYHHQLPENSAGVSLTQEQARSIAHTALQEQFNLNLEHITEISVTQEQLPHRINWLFVFADNSIDSLKIGQARISIVISGDTVSDAARTIHVPEEWERKEQNKQHMLTIITLIFFVLLISLLCIGLVIAVRQKYRASFIFSKKLFIVLFIIFFTISCINSMNIWHTLIGSFDTRLPLQNQLFHASISQIILACMSSIFYAFLLCCVLLFKPYSTFSLPFHLKNIPLGICIGFFVTGILSYARLLVPLNEPLWPLYDVLGYKMPLLASVCNNSIHYIWVTMVFCLLYILIETATKHWQKNKILFTIICMIFGLTLIPLPSLKLLPMWSIAGIFIGYIFLLLYKYCIRYNYSLIPLSTAPYIILCCIQQGIFNAYPGALSATILNSGIIITIAIMWYLYSHKRNIH